MALNMQNSIDSEKIATRKTNQETTTNKENATHLRSENKEEPTNQDKAILIPIST